MSRSDYLLAACCGAWILATGAIAVNGSPRILAAIADAGIAVWVQSVGTVAAVFAAIAAAFFQGWISKRDRERERKERAFRVASAAGTRISMYVQLAHANLVGMGPNLLTECDRIESGLRSAIEIFEVQAIPDLEDDSAVNTALNLIEVGRTTLANVQACRQPISQGFPVPQGRFQNAAQSAVVHAQAIAAAKRKSLPWLYSTDQ